MNKEKIKEKLKSFCICAAGTGGRNFVDNCGQRMYSSRSRKIIT